MKKGILTLALMGVFSAINADDINIYTPGEGEGIAYFLPKTSLELNIIATKVKYTPGDFCQYANRYLKLSNVTSEPSEYWEIKSIDMVAVGVPDSTKAYIIKLNDKSVSSNIELTENGIVKAINTTTTEEKHPEYKLEKSPEAENPRKYMTEEILSAGSTAKMSELTAKEIYNIRESKNMILRGQADAMPKDGASLKLIIDNLDKQEKALLSMFSGNIQKEDKLFSIRITPEGNLNNEVIVRFSKKLGVLSTDNLAGEPIYINVENNSPSQSLNIDGNEDKKKKRIKGILYNIPGKANISVSYKGKKIIENNHMPIAQFGGMETLVDDLFNKKVNTRVIFNTVTGNIQKIDKD